MSELKTQEERLDYLVEAFKEDSSEYRDIQTPTDANGKRRVLRSLMNIRMPKRLAPQVLSVQNDYLRERVKGNGMRCAVFVPAFLMVPAPARRISSA